MESKRNTFLMNLILAFVLLVTSYSAVQAQAQPDLFITNASVTKLMRGDEVYKLVVTVTVANYCRESLAPDSIVAIDFYTDEVMPPARSIHDFSTARSFPALAGGESQTITFSISRYDVSYLGYAHELFNWIKATGKIPRTVLKADDGLKVEEADENNNWFQLNPYKAPASLSGQFQCSPKV